MIPLLLLLAAMPWTNADATPAEDPRQRVIVFVNRYKEVPAFVEYEDSYVLLVETRDGSTDCFHKDEIISVAHLLDVGDPAPGVVILRDNTKQNGLVVEDGFDEVSLLIQGVPLSLPRSRVSHVVLEAPIEEQYLEYRLGIDSSDLYAHLNLCRWLIDRQAYDLARKELNQAWTLHQDPEAARLLRLVEAQIRLQEKDRSKETPDKDADQTDRKQEILSDREVNLMRVYEIDLDDPPKVLVARDAVMELFDRYGASGMIPDTEREQTELASAPSIDIVRLMFRLRARDLYDQIQVLSEPKALRLFRERVHDTWLMNNCSTTRCHGGTDAGRFALIRSGSSNDRTRYTNLLTIDRFTLDDGTPLVDWDSPENSRLIQYGMSRDQTLTPHPDVPGWTPVFGGSRRSMANGAEAWIEAMMNTPRPVYPVRLSEITPQSDPDPDDEAPEATPRP